MTAHVRGRVQGVGFRWWARSNARELGLCGGARNLDDGRVQIVAEGTQEACRDLLDRLQVAPVPAGRPGEITEVTAAWESPQGLQGFDLR